MLIPSLQINNFFKDPDQVVQYANSLEYKIDSEGRWPGVRAQPLSDIRYDFFNMTCRKILSVLYPMNYVNMRFDALQQFQVISPDQADGEGWIHQDIYSEFTAIIYLSPHKNCGTNLYVPKNEMFRLCGEPGTHASHLMDIKADYYKNEKPRDNKYYEALKQNNHNFTKTASFNSIYNSMVIFDGHTAHNANAYKEDNCNDPRMTLITFFTKLTSTETIKYSGGEMLKI